MGRITVIVVLSHTEMKKGRGLLKLVFYYKRYKSELTRRSSAHILFSSCSRHSQSHQTSSHFGIGGYLESLMFICGSGTHPLGLTHPSQSRINLLAVTSGTGLGLEEPDNMLRAQG